MRFARSCFSLIKLTNPKPAKSLHYSTYLSNINVTYQRYCEIDQSTDQANHELQMHALLNLFNVLIQFRIDNNNGIKSNTNGDSTMTHDEFAVCESLPAICATQERLAARKTRKLPPFSPVSTPAFAGSVFSTQRHLFINYVYQSRPIK